MHSGEADRIAATTNPLLPAACLTLSHARRLAENAGPHHTLTYNGEAPDAPYHGISYHGKIVARPGEIVSQCMPLLRYTGPLIGSSQEVCLMASDCSDTAYPG